MSKVTWVLAPLALAVSLSTFAATSTDTLDITINGQVTGSVCQAQFPQSIELGRMALDTLPQSTATKLNQVSVLDSGNLEITGCEKGQQYTVTLLGTGDANDANVLANVAIEDAAKDVGVAVFDSMNALHIGSKTEAVTVSDEGTSTKQFFLAMVKTSNAPVEGEVKVTGQLQIDYL